MSFLGFGITLLETILLSLLIDAYKRHPKKKLLDYLKEARKEGY